MNNEALSAEMRGQTAGGMREDYVLARSSHRCIRFGPR